MIKNLSINGLRGVSQCQIEDIGRINLFLGRNNCGKSTILEALFLLTGATYPINFQRINILRKCPFREGEDLRFSFYGTRSTDPIIISGIFENGSRTLVISYNEESIEKVAAHQLPTDINAPLPKIFQVNFDLDLENGHHIKTQLAVKQKQPENVMIKGDTNHEGHIPARFISPAEPYENVENYFAAIVENKREDYVRKIMSVIDPSIIDIVFAGNRIMADIGFEKRIPIQLMGDGLKKVLSVVVNMAMVPNGILLIDEVDNGLHYSSMPILWKAIVESAKMYNVQVFATTHNVESLRALNEILENDTYKDLQSNFRSYTIRREENGEHKVIKAEYSQFNHIINQDLELR